MLYRIEAPHFVAGVIVEDGKVIDSAPIVKYMIGWELERIESYCREKGWKVTLNGG